MGKIYGRMKSGKQEVILEDDDHLELEISIGSGKNTKPFVGFVVDNTGEGFVCRVNGQDLRKYIEDLSGE